MMFTLDELKELVREARKRANGRNFTQSFELYLALDSKRIDKGDVQLNEVIHLPHRPSRTPRIAFIGGGDLAIRARDAGVDTIIPAEGIDRLSTNRREARKLIREHDFFIAEASLMPKIGRALGRFLGPRGKMPLPLTLNAPIDAIIERLRSSVRIRSRGQFSLSAKIGDEEMEDEEMAENASTILNALTEKLPQGERAIKKILIKLTMGKPVERELAVVKRK